MINQIISEKEINFNDLEKEIFQIGCEVAQSIMIEVLESIDERLAKQAGVKMVQRT